MAKKGKRNSKTSKKSKTSGVGRFFQSVKHYSTSERVHFVIGLLLCIFSIYVGIAMFSYFFTGKSDQSIVANFHAKDFIGLLKGDVENWAGVRGAYIADTIIDKWYGIPSFFMIFFLLSFGAVLMRLGKMNLLLRFMLCTVLTLWSSLLLATFLGKSDLFYNPGGRHGLYMYDFLQSNFGLVGVGLLLLLGLILISVFISSATIPWVREWFERFLKITRIPSMKGGINKNNDEEEDEDESVEAEDEDEEMIDNDGNDKSINDVSEKLVRRQSVTKVKDENFTVEVAEPEDETVNVSGLGNYDPRLDLSRYRFPEVTLLNKYGKSNEPVDMDEQNYNKERITKTLETFGITIASIKATVGPTITLYEIVPEAGVTIAKIRSREDDIALSLAALGIRIIAPIPGKGTVGIEVPNKKPQIVSMESVISSKKFIESKDELPIVLGRTITNEVFTFDLTKAPHLLVAGATGQGKSVGLNAIITSLLYKKHPAELKFVLIDPKRVEFSMYQNIEHHYLAKLPDVEKPIIVNNEDVVPTLNSLCKEMEDRYDLLTKARVRKISEYNEKFINRQLNPEKGHKFMPYIVVIIDEYGDLMMTAGKEIETPITRIAQKARAVGIHMIISTQRPSTNVITGIIKANFPARIAFKTTAMVDSRTILDAAGANKLVGKGDLLYSQNSDMTRVQCAFVDTSEIEKIVDFISGQPGYETAYPLPEPIVEPDYGAVGNGGGGISLSSNESLFEEAAHLIVLQQLGSTSLIQRKFGIGYNKAGRLMDQLEKAGIVGPINGSKPRQVLIPDEYALEQKLAMLKIS